MSFFRIPVDAKNANLFVEYNVFLIIGILLFVYIYYGKHMPIKHCITRRNSRLSCAFLAFLLISIGGVLEHYYWSLCPVEQERLNATQDILLNNVALLKRLNVPVVVTEGTLLAVLRELSTLSVWDQDCDVYVLDDEKGDELVNKILGETQRTFKNRRVTFDAERRFIQVYDSSGGHGDIWFWRPIVKNGVAYVTNPDFTFNDLDEPNCFRKDWLFPPVTHKWTHIVNGEMRVANLPIPHKRHEYLTNMYGEDYMTPYRNRMQCMENLVTGKASSLRVLLYLVFTLVSVYMAVTHLPFTASKSGSTKAVRKGELRNVTVEQVTSSDEAIRHRA